MENNDIGAIVTVQRNYFGGGETLEVDFRMWMLRSLEDAINRYEREIYRALWEYLHKSEQESYLTELAMSAGKFLTASPGLKNGSARGESAHDDHVPP